MPSTAVEISLDPIDTFTPQIDALIARMSNLLPVWPEVYKAFLGIESERFSKEGPGWKELADSTAAQRSRAGAGAYNPILDRSGAPGGGALRKSLTEVGAPGAVFEPTPDGAFMGTSVETAQYHQHGTKRMAARPVVDMTEADAATFADIIDVYLFDSLPTSGGLFSVGAIGL
jgi:phage gpG-like protein